MRITADVYAAGSRWAFDFPDPPPLPSVYSDGRFDYSAGRAHLAKFPCVSWADSDDELVVAVALSFLDLVRQWRDEVHSPEASRDSRTHERIGRRMDAGLSTKCRVEFRRRHGGTVAMRVTHANLSNAVEKEMFERCLAMALADLARCFAEKLARDYGREIIGLDEETAALSAEAVAIREAAERKDETRRRNEARFLCDRYRDGFCTPCKFDCPHCRGGMCVEVAE